MPISTGMHPHIEAILTTTGVVRSSDHPHLVSALARAKRSGEIVNPLPGIFLPAKERTRDQWLQAVSAWAAPLGVIHECPRQRSGSPARRLLWCTWLIQPFVRAPE